MKRPAFARPDRHRHLPGFSLIEMTVVLAITMILALVVFSATLRQLDRVAAEREATRLASYATSLQNAIQRTGYIPGPANWVTNLAAELGSSSNAIALNDRQQPRLLLVDPRLQLAGAGLPFAQGVLGSTNRPFNARLILLSRLGPTALPSALTSGSYSTADFTNLWNWAGAENTLPSGALWTGWSGSSADLQVQRLNLEPLFVRLLLVNYPTNLVNRGRYVVGSVTNFVPNGLGIDAYFLRTTLIGLVNADGATDFQLLNRDTSIYYDRTTWRLNAAGFGDSISAARATDLLSTMDEVMGLFRASPRNANALGGTTTDSTANAITNFMGAYIVWANAGFPKSGTIYTTAKAAQAAAWTNMKNLANNIQQGQCQ